MSDSALQLQLARELCEARGLSSEIGQGNLLRIFKGVRALRMGYNLLSPNQCALHLTSQGPCDGFAAFELRLEDGPGGRLNIANMCARCAARWAWRRGGLASRSTMEAPDVG